MKTKLFQVHIVFPLDKNRPTEYYTSTIRMDTLDECLAVLYDELNRKYKGTIAIPYIKAVKVEV